MTTSDNKLVADLIDFASSRGYYGFSATFLECSAGNKFISVSGDAGLTDAGGICQKIRRNTDIFITSLGFKVSQTEETGVAVGPDPAKQPATSREVLAAALYAYCMVEGSDVFSTVCDAAELLGCSVEFNALVYKVAADILNRSKH